MRERESEREQKKQKYKPESHLTTFAPFMTFIVPIKYRPQNKFTENFINSANNRLSMAHGIVSISGVWHAQVL